MGLPSLHLNPPSPALHASQTHPALLGAVWWPRQVRILMLIWPAQEWHIYNIPRPVQLTCASLSGALDCTLSLFRAKHSLQYILSIKWAYVPPPSSPGHSEKGRGASLSWGTFGEGKKTGQLRRGCPVWGWGWVEALMEGQLFG